MDINTMTDEALAIMSADLDAERAMVNRATHHFGGIDGRCFGCDAKPWHRFASEPCPDYR